MDAASQPCRILCAIIHAVFWVMPRSRCSFIEETPFQGRGHQVDAERPSAKWQLAGLHDRASFDAEVLSAIRTPVGLRFPPRYNADRSCRRSNECALTTSWPHLRWGNIQKLRQRDPCAFCTARALAPISSEFVCHFLCIFVAICCFRFTGGTRWKQRLKALFRRLQRYVGRSRLHGKPRCRHTQATAVAGVDGGYPNVVIPSSDPACSFLSS